MRLGDLTRYSSPHLSALLGCTFLFVCFTLASGCRQGENSPNPGASQTNPEQSGSPDPSSTTKPEAPPSPADPPPTVHPKDPPKAPNRADAIAQAVSLQQRGAFTEARIILQRLLVGDPQDFETLFRLANLEAADGNLAVGIELLESIPSDTPDAGVAALGVGADLCLRLKRYDDAADRYEQILEIVPSLNRARRMLALIRNRQGRRHEAVKLIRKLCLDGDVTQDELHALIVESDAMYDPPGSQPAEGVRPYWPIGQAAVSRELFTKKRFLEAASGLVPFVERGEASPSNIALFGRLAVESQQNELIALWKRQSNRASAAYPEHWAALGALLVREAEYLPAITALTEALRLDPTDLQSIRRLFQSLRSVGRTEDADRWIERYALLNRILATSNAIADETSTHPQNYLTIAESLRSAGRNLEAVLWESVAASKRQDRRQLAALKETLAEVLQSNTAFPDTATLLCGMQPSERELPTLTDLPDASHSALSPHSLPDDSIRSDGAPQIDQIPRFLNTAEAVGLEHAYRIATRPVPDGFAIYQAYGGGVAVLDFDLNGDPDLYLTQGDADPPFLMAGSSDQLYRSIRVDDIFRVRDVSGPSMVTEKSYTVGVTAGDWNQDGFPDLAVSNIGINRLMINRGDGTFQSVDLDDASDTDRFCTSLAIADVTGDQLPDLVILNYLNDPEINRLPERDSGGNVINAVSPKSFLPARDRIYENLGNGRLHRRELGTSSTDACTGLGIVVTDLTARFPGNEIFVGNDVMRNQFWGRGTDDQWSDIASLTGCAYGSLGSSTGSMGIALADFNRDETLDIHISNYVNEPSSLFMGDRQIYRDLNVKYGLAKETTPKVGFGSQACDFDNDGWQDLLITNGHVEDLESHGEVFRQPMQLFANRGDRFQRLDVTESEYWQTPHLGRGLATLDFNRDGRTDFLVTDLQDQTALMINHSSDKNHWIDLQLIGIESERDAIGARVRVRAGDQSWLQWVAAGSGYLASNEPTLHFGLGQTKTVTEVDILWPSGKTQQISNLEPDRRYLILENSRTAHATVER